MEKTLNEYIHEYKTQLQKGDIKYAYRGLMEFMANLKNDLQHTCPQYKLSTTIHQGYMDITYFSFTNELLKGNQLKTIILFNHETFNFEIWLAAQNKKIQKKYWEVFKKNDWNTYSIPSTIVGRFSIIEGTLAQHPDFSNLHSLKEQIISEIILFINEVTMFFNKLK